MSESFSKEEIDQLVKLKPTAIQEATKWPLSGTKEESHTAREKEPRISVASIGNDGKVRIEPVKV